MQNRSPAAVLILTIVTIGLYGLIWNVKTKTELNSTYHAEIPTAWLWLVPFVGGLYWMWRWSMGAEKATGTSAISIFLLMLVFPIIGIPVLVSKFNQALPPMAGATALRAA